MTVHNPTHREIKKSAIEMEQMSWDDVYEVLARIPMTLNPVSNTLERQTGIQGNPSIALTYTNGNLTRVVKTIGAATYTKDITYTSGNLTGVTAWS